MFGFVFLIYEKSVLKSFWLKEETAEGRLGRSGEVVTAHALSVLNLFLCQREMQLEE